MASKSFASVKDGAITGVVVVNNGPLGRNEDIRDPLMVKMLADKMKTVHDVEILDVKPGHFHRGGLTDMTALRLAEAVEPLIQEMLLVVRGGRRP